MMINDRNEKTHAIINNDIKEKKTIKGTRKKNKYDINKENNND